MALWPLIELIGYLKDGVTRALTIKGEVTQVGSIVLDKVLTTTDLAVGASFTSNILDAHTGKETCISFAVDADQPIEVQLLSSFSSDMASSTLVKSYNITVPTSYTADERTIVIPYTLVENKYYRVLFKNVGDAITNGLSIRQYSTDKFVDMSKYFHVLLEKANEIRDILAHDLIYTNVSVFKGQKHIYIENTLNQPANITLNIGIGEGYGGGFDIDVIEYQIGANDNKILTFADLPILAGGFERIKGSIQCDIAPTSGSIKVAMGLS